MNGFNIQQLNSLVNEMAHHFNDLDTPNYLDVWSQVSIDLNDDQDCVFCTVTDKGDKFGLVCSTDADWGQLKWQESKEVFSAAEAIAYFEEAIARYENKDNFKRKAL